MAPASVGYLWPSRADSSSFLLDYSGQGLYNASEVEPHIGIHVVCRNISSYRDCVYMCETEEKMFYSRINSLLVRCLSRNILIFIGNCNATTGTERAGYKLWHQKNQLLFFWTLQNSNGWKLQVLGISSQSCTTEHVVSAAKEIGRILVSARWSLLQNFSVFRSAEIFATDHRTVAAMIFSYQD